VSTAAGRRPGRPRSTEADQAIVRAALELLVEGGYRTLTMEAVRARSGVGKATLYRRYGSKGDLVAHVVRHLNQDIAAPDTGSLAGDWEAIAQTVLGAAQATRATVLLPRLLAESVDEPELHAIFYENLVRPRRAALLEVLRRAVARGDLREDVDLELVVDLLVGPYIYRLLISGGDVDALFPPQQLLEALMRGLAR
jgi:AcrR family transcriptional regulator